MWSAYLVWSNKPPSYQVTPTYLHVLHPRRRTILSNGHLRVRTNTGLLKVDSSTPNIVDSHVTRVGRAGTIPNYVNGIHCFMGMKGFFVVCKGHRGNIYTVRKRYRVLQLSRQQNNCYGEDMSSTPPGRWTPPCPDLILGSTHFPI